MLSLSAQSILLFQSLIGTLQTIELDEVEFMERFVSIPYRYATNKGLKLIGGGKMKGFNPL